MTTQRLIVLGIVAASMLLLFGCSGMTEVDDDPAVTLTGFWTGEAKVGDGEAQIALTVNTSRFVVMYGYRIGERSYSEVISGEWSATEDAITVTWIEERRAAMANLGYTVTADSLSVQGLGAIHERMPKGAINLKREASWQASNLVGSWVNDWKWDDGRSREFKLTYNADGTCSWYDLFKYAEEEERRDSLVSLAGTCTLDFAEHFLFMKVTEEETTYQRDPFKGHTLRFAFARTTGDWIAVSAFWDEMQYLPLEGEWADSVYRPHGGYYLWLHKP